LSRRVWTRMSSTSTFIVNRPPEPMLLACDPHDHFVQVPATSRTWLPLPKLSGKQRSELADPPTDRFIGDIEIAFREHALDITEAEGERG